MDVGKYRLEVVPTQFENVGGKLVLIALSAAA